MHRLLLAFPVLSAGLGIWQLYRLQWKLALIEQRQERVRQLPVDLPVDPSQRELADFEFRPVRVHGEFDHSQEQYMSPRWGVRPGPSGELEAGFHVITPLKRLGLQDRILVNRGWVPTDQRDPRTRTEGQLTGSRSVLGLLRPGEMKKASFFTPENRADQREWHWLDVPRLALMTDSRPILIDALRDPPNPGGLPAGGVTPLELRNDHLGYAITWFTLSAATAFLFLRARPRTGADLFSRQLKRS